MANYVCMYISYDHRYIGTFPVTAELMNRPEGARPSKSLKNSHILSLGTCKLIIGNAILDLVSSYLSMVASDKGRMARKIWPRLDKRLQKSKLTTVLITGHFIIATHARRIGLAHFARDFC